MDNLDIALAPELWIFVTALLVAALGQGATHRCGAQLSQRTLQERKRLGTVASSTCTVAARGVGRRCGKHRGSGWTRADWLGTRLWLLALAIAATAFVPFH